MPPRLFAAVVLAGALCARHAQAGKSTDGSEIVIEFDGGVGVRVQLISKRLVRVEPRSRWGYEDRPTFNVLSRDWGARVGVRTRSLTSPATEPVTIQTNYYTVAVNRWLLQSGMPSFSVLDASGELIYDSSSSRDNANLLNFPHCCSAKAYALVDSPRFFVPEWGLSPAPASEKQGDTNGYDFSNNVWGDTYVFILGKSREDWLGAREDFVKAFGAVPLLPDYAFGTWWTYWHQYNEREAKDEIQRWETDSLPLDVWGLDMNWRFIEDMQDREYDHPNTTAFPDFTEWFQWLQSQNLRTFFNDHAYPKSTEYGQLQTSPEEVEFRWQGLTSWLERGLDFWWFDHNWAFCIPAPTRAGAEINSSWQGLTNVAWGSHVYYSVDAQYEKSLRPLLNQRHRRPLALTKFAPGDYWTEQDDTAVYGEVPAQHRFPVWWTGDNVNLQGSVESMVNLGLYAFKPYLHSDCGGNGNFSGGDLLRWTAHCALGSILRFHGGPHQPWRFGDWVEHWIREYLQLRYRLMPTIMAFAQRATLIGFPLVARSDFYWPDQLESRTAGQYIWCDDLLVAPIWDSTDNVTTRSVWMPPGQWQDAWTGEMLEGPRDVRATQPYERQPMWHRFDGGLTVLSSEAALRVEDLDWSTLVLEARAGGGPFQTMRSVFERGSAQRTDIAMQGDGQGTVTFAIGEGPPRAWVIRLNLQKGQVASSASLDGAARDIKHIEPSSSADQFFPLRGAGRPPAPKAGPVAELALPRDAGRRQVVIVVGNRDETQDRAPSIVAYKVGPSGKPAAASAAVPASARASLSPTIVATFSAGSGGAAPAAREPARDPAEASKADAVAAARAAGCMALAAAAVALAAARRHATAARHTEAAATMTLVQEATRSGAAE